MLRLAILSFFFSVFSLSRATDLGLSEGEAAKTWRDGSGSARGVLLGLRRSPRVAERNKVNSLASPRILFKTSLLGSGKVLTSGKSTEGRRVNKEYYTRKRRFNGSVLSQCTWVVSWLAGGHVQLPRGLGTVHLRRGARGSLSCRDTNAYTMRLGRSQAPISSCSGV